MKKFLACLLIGAVFVGCQQKLTPESAKQQMIDSLLHEMTLEEKLGQLHLTSRGDITTGKPAASRSAEQIREGKVGGILNLKGVHNIREIQRVAVEETRTHIPLIFGMDVIHGYETIFPIPLALSCTWNLTTIERAARIASQEATADGICWTYSPMVDICRDARWGRIAEGGGEDPYLGSQIAAAMVRGYQGKDLADSTTMMACVKHFALYGAPDGGRDYNAVDMSYYRMYNDYLPPYKAAIDAGAGSVMSSFNTINGIPASCNHWLLSTLLREEWGFRGFVVSDWNAVEEMIHHGVASDLTDAGIQALKAGMDMDMAACSFRELAPAVEDGRLSEKDIDQACRRILEAKYDLGLFADPYRYCDTTRREKDIFTVEHRRIARETAREAIVLLKNEGDLLPLKKEGTIALIGPIADVRANMAGTWSVAARHQDYKSIREGLADALQGQARLLYAKGCNLMYSAEQESRVAEGKHAMRDNRSTAEMEAEALQIARQADIIILAMGEASGMSGEASCFVNIEMPDAQRDLMRKIVALGKKTILLHVAGRPTVMNWENEHIPAILETWFLGSEGADAMADVLFGEYAPSGRLTTSFPRHVGQLPLGYRQMSTGRPVEGDDFDEYGSCYIDVANTPLYPFGYGLSYTSFDYTSPVLSDSVMGQNDTVYVSVKVTNTGKRTGKETVQLYIKDVVATSARPIEELRGFTQVTLEAGETQEVQFAIHKDVLAYYNAANVWTLEPGLFRIMVAHDSREALRQEHGIRLNVQ